MRSGPASIGANPQRSAIAETVAFASASSEAIGTSATSPEGLSAWQLMEAVHACGLDPKVGAMDLVEIDPGKDVKDLTSRTGCSVLLTFFAGLYRRLNGNDGYSQ